MAREFDGPLSADDLVWLKARYPESYVARLVDVHGTEDGVDVHGTEDGAEEGENGASTPDEASTGDSGSDTADGSGDGSEEDEDLIGDAPAFDILGSTESEVKAWAESASDADKAEALSTEQGRTDREPRKGVVSLLS